MLRPRPAWDIDEILGNVTMGRCGITAIRWGKEGMPCPEIIHVTSRFRRGIERYLNGISAIELGAALRLLLTRLVPYTICGFLQHL